jgi:hypothetical protein
MPARGYREGDNDVSAPVETEQRVGFASGLPLSEPEIEKRERARRERQASELAFDRARRLMGIPPGQPSRSLRRLWARMAGERDEVGA